MFHLVKLIIKIQTMSLVSKSILEDILYVGVLKNFVNFTGKHLCWSLFLIKQQVLNETRNSFKK